MPSTRVILLAEGAGWLHEFRAFSPLHGVTVLVCVGAIAAACVLGRRWKGTDREHRFAMVLGWWIVATQVFATVWRALPGQWDLNESLPLHLCRLVVWAAAIALITGDWRARALTYFWGLGLSTQGMITPMWGDGVASVSFWMFWTVHTQIVGAAVYDIVVRGFGPRLRHLWFTLAASAAFVAVVIPVNLWLNTNYSYLGRWTYEGTTIVDALGPWPGRAVAMILLVLAWFFVLYGAGALVRRLKHMPAREPAPTAG